MKSAHADMLEVPEYELTALVGKGASGEVWLARNRITQSWNAVKIVRKQEGSDVSFRRELSAIRKYEPISRTNPAFMGIFHVGESSSGGFFYYVMELADPVANQRLRPEGPGSGTYQPHTLRYDLESHGPLRIPECIGLAVALASALKALHGLGLLHRDIKPSNIIFVGGMPKLADIGLVEFSDATASMVGTPGYVAPEGPSSERADIYSLGKIIYEASSGKNRSRFPEPPTQITNPDELRLWSELNEVILKACRPNPDDRYPCAAAMLKDLELLQTGHSLRRLRHAEQQLRQVVRGAYIAAVLLAIFGGAYLYQRHQSSLLRAAASESRRTLVRLNVANGIRQMDEGDMTGALHWFIEGLRLDAGNPQQEEFHRRRIQSVINQIPTLISIGTHKDGITSCDLSLDETRLVTASLDQTARVWDLATGAPLSPPLRHEAKVTSVGFTPDGSGVLTSSDDGTAILWSITNGFARVTVRHNTHVSATALSPDGHFIASGSEDGTLKVTSVTQESRLVDETRLAGGIEAILWNHTGTLFATADRSGAVCLWDTKTGRTSKQALRHDLPVRCLAFSLDDRFLASGGEDDTARLLDLSNPASVLPPLQHRGSVRQVAFSRDGATLVTAGGQHRKNGEIRFWRVTSGSSLRDPVLRDSPINSLSIGGDDEICAVGESNGTLEVLSLDSGTSITPPLRFSRSIAVVRFSEDGARLLVAGRDGVWRYWNLAAPLHRTAPFRQYMPVRCDFSSDGAYLLRSGMDDAEVTRVSDWVSVFKKYRPIIGLFPTGRSNMFGYYGTSVGILSLNTNAEPVVDFSESGSGASFEPRNQVFASWLHSSNAISLRYLQAAARRLPVDCGFTPRRASFTPNGDHLVVCGGSVAGTGEGWIRAFDLRLTNWTTLPIRLESAPTSLDISRSGDLALVACGDDSPYSRAATLYSIPSLQTNGIQFRHTDGVTIAKFSYDSERVITGGEDGSAMIWNRRTGHLIGTPLRHSRGITGVQFNENAKIALTASLDGTARLWDAETGDALTPFLRHNAGLTSVVMGPDGNRVFTGGWDHQIKVWETQPTALSIRDLSDFATVVTGKELIHGALVEAKSMFGLPKMFEDSALSSISRAESATLQRNWHLGAALHACQVRNWRSARFHSCWLIQHTLADRQIEFIYSRAVAELARIEQETSDSSVDSISLIYPARSTSTPKSCVDLSHSYNAPLFSRWHQNPPGFLPLGIPTGLHSIIGTPFDVRGFVQVEPNNSNPVEKFTFPAEVRIPIQRRARRLHFLHGVIQPAAEGAVYINYTIKCSNGLTTMIPVFGGNHIEAWHLPSPSRLQPPASVAWRGTFPVDPDVNVDATLFEYAWENPFPDQQIESIKIGATENAAFLAGITIDE